MGYGQRHIVELTSGGFSRVDGTPIQSAAELTAVIPDGPVLKRALAWWERRDEEPEDEASERPVLFVRGAPRYADTGEELGSLNEVLEAFPEQSPFREAALAWWQAKSTRMHAAAQHQALAFDQGSGMETPELPVTRKPARQSRVEALINS